MTSPRSDLAVERTLYFDYHDIYPGSHTVRAAPGASRTWYFAEGSCDKTDRETLAFLNPGPRTALVLTTLIRADGRLELGELALHRRDETRTLRARR